MGGKAYKNTASEQAAAAKQFDRLCTEAGRSAEAATKGELGVRLRSTVDRVITGQEPPSGMTGERREGIGMEMLRLPINEENFARLRCVFFALERDIPMQDKMLSEVKAGFSKFEIMISGGGVSKLVGVDGVQIRISYTGGADGKKRAADMLELIRKTCDALVGQRTNGDQEHVLQSSSMTPEELNDI
jgi:hypothetical protein